MTLLVNLPAITSTSGSDLFYINQGGVSRKISLTQLITAISGSVLTGLVIQDEGTQISTTCTILNLIGPAVSVAMAGNRADVTINAQAGIQFKSVGTNLGTSGTGTSFDTSPGLSMTRNANAISIALEEVIVTDATTARTLGVSDVDKEIRFTSGSAVTYTFNTLTPIPNVGRRVRIRQAGAGRVTLSAGAGVTLNAFGGIARTVGQHATIIAVHIGSNVWDIEGQVG